MGHAQYVVGCGVVLGLWRGLTLCCEELQEFGEGIQLQACWLVLGCSVDQSQGVARHYGLAETRPVGQDLGLGGQAAEVETSRVERGYSGLSEILTVGPSL